MARPCLKEERTEEILKAYETCIVKYGIEGATSKKVAEIAGIARPLVRHHVGNNDELFEKLVERFIERTQKQIEETQSKEFATVEELADWICRDRRSENYNDLIIAKSLILKASRDEKMKKRLYNWFSSFNKLSEDILRKRFPNANQEDIEFLSIIILNYYIAVDNLSPLGDMKDMKERSTKLIRRRLYELDKTNK